MISMNPSSTVRGAAANNQGLRGIGFGRLGAGGGGIITPSPVDPGVVPNARSFSAAPGSPVGVQRGARQGSRAMGSGGFQALRNYSGADYGGEFTSGGAFGYGRDK